MAKDHFNYRNYNIGRTIDEKTSEFEAELANLVNKYDGYMETESFNVKSDDVTKEERP